MASAAFSRLQLAAALVEYDNDDEDPSKPRRSAHDSAIFAHLRRGGGPRRGNASRRSTDYLGVALPSDVESLRGPESIYDGRESVFDGRRSRSSIDALRNPFGRDSTYEGVLDDDDDEEHAEMEVDLASWGLDGYIPEDKGKGKKKAKSDFLPNPHDVPQRPGLRSEPGRQGMHSSRSMSMGNFDSFGAGGAFLDAKSTVDDNQTARRHSFGSPLDLPMPTQLFEDRTRRVRTASPHAPIESISLPPPLHSIPFPTAERSPSPAPTAALDVSRPLSRGSESVLNAGHGRTSSFGSQILLTDEKPNPFAVRSPSPDRASRFDPKSAGLRSSSYGTSVILSPGLEDGATNPFSLRPPSPSRSSRFDPKVRARTASVASFGTQMLLDADAHSSDDNRSEAAGRARPYSRLELMRPKVLIMPSPLQSAMPTAPTNGAMLPRAIEGAELHASDAAPLPPGARSIRRASTTLSMLDPSPAEGPGLVASNSFTPNPRATLSLSQLTFRNNLIVDGQRDPAYADIEGHLRRATEDGEQIEVEEEPEPEPIPMPEIMIDPADRSKRPAGKLYGRSLIDAIEARKAEMRGKQRVFRGDDRPSMMARPQMQRSSTLIDPESLRQRPQSQLMDTSRSQPSLSRRNTLLQLQDELPGTPRGQLSGAGIDGVNQGGKKSVFGVDTLWERELAKLKEIEEQERVAAEAEAARQAEGDTRRGKKGKGKKKGKHKDRKDQLAYEDPGTLVQSTSDLAIERSPEPQTHTSESKTAASPYMLPEIQRATARKRTQPPPPTGDTDESDSDEVPNKHKRATAKDTVADEWIAGSSDEERGRRRRASSSAQLAPQSTVSLAAPRLVGQGGDDSSDEDVPLVATIGRAVQRVTTRAHAADDDSDEEKPLMALLDKARLTPGPLKLPSLDSSDKGLFLAGKSDADDEDEDEEPLGLRVSRVMSSSQFLGSTANQDADDDKPLAFHPEQMRRTQYMMAQQQQQQMMMQAQATQLHQSMIFGAPSFMGSSFFGPPIPPTAMMVQPPLASTPAPAQDVSKFGRVDKWRHDVAVEGET